MSILTSLMVGVYLHGALAISGVFVLALVKGNTNAAMAAIVAAGAAYVASVIACISAGNPHPDQLLVQTNWVMAAISCLAVVAGLFMIYAG